MSSIDIKELSKQFHQTEKAGALKTVSFSIEQGETFGIIGPNGSGKTTLLKIMAGIFQPTSGRVVIRGTAHFFFQLGLGFHPDLDIRQNAYVYGAFLGIGRKEIDRHFSRIAAFAKLQKFDSAKLFTLSPGMQLKLAFSIAILAKGDIFVFDEIFAVGDVSFNRKVEETFLSLKKQRKTIVFVSQELDKIERFCDRCGYLDQGRLVAIGKPETVVEKYR